MADITRRIPDCDDDCEGERGERGERGRRGPAGPAGPAGSSSALTGPTTGPGSLDASEDIPPGFVITPGGSARLAVADGTSRQNAIGVATAQAATGSVVHYVLAGFVSLPASTWDTVTDESGGLVPGSAYYLSRTTPGHLTREPPTTEGFIVRIGVATDQDTLDVGIDGGTPPPPTQHYAYFSGGLLVRSQISDVVSQFAIPYCPRQGLISIGVGNLGSPETYGIGFGDTRGSSDDDYLCWVSPVAGEIRSLHVNVRHCVNVSLTYQIRVSAACNGPFVTQMEIDAVTESGCYQTTPEVPVVIGPGDKISFRAVLRRLV